jgi:3-hydroxyisobutyrate dehydrogenase-like beta-hydroxyacid dehydrogenase
VKIALLHPGAMGATLGGALVAAGHEVLWLSEGRSAATARRAADAGLVAVETLPQLVATSDAIISVCPPHAAADVASAAAGAGFRGPFLDANAVAPATARALAEVVGPGFIDGGIVGPPAVRAGTTRLYVSGGGADQVRRWFGDGVLAVHVVPGDAGAASALKMCYAAYTKGTSALLLAIRALAEAEGVGDSLLDEWRISQPELPGRSEAAARGTAAKAWRFVGEMEEIAASFEARGLPGGFHQAAAQIYERMQPLKDASDVDLDRVLEALGAVSGTASGPEPG